MSLAKLIAPVAALALASAAHAGLTGMEFSAYYAYPDIMTNYDSATVAPPTFIVGPGAEASVNVENVTQIGIDFTDNSLTLVLTTTLENPTWNPSTFNGLVFDLIAGSPLGILSAAVDPATTMGGFDSSRISFDDGQIAINWAGLSYVDGTTVAVNFTHAVPEPSSWLLVLGALAFLGTHRSIRHRLGHSQQVPAA